MSDLVLPLHLLATLALVGLIWIVQVVHYPLMAEVREGFVRYHELHCARIGWLVAPLMGLEALTAMLLLQARPAGVGTGWVWLGLGLVAVIWLATALLSVPEHARLALGYDAEAIQRLVRTNWVRTLAWSARGALVLWMTTRAGGLG